MKSFFLTVSLLLLYPNSMFLLSPARAFVAVSTRTTKTRSRVATSRALRPKTVTTCRAASSSSTDTTSIINNAATERMRVESEQAYQELRQHFGDTPPPFFMPPDAAALHNYLDQHGIDTILFDCDGVLYRSPDAAPGAAAALQALIANDRHVYFVTNNSAANPRQLRNKLTQLLDFSSSSELLLQQEQMISTALTAAHYLKFLSWCRRTGCERKFNARRSRW